MHIIFKKILVSPFWLWANLSALVTERKDYHYLDLQGAVDFFEKGDK